MQVSVDQLMQIIGQQQVELLGMRGANQMLAKKNAELVRQVEILTGALATAKGEDARGETNEAGAEQGAET